MLKRGDVYYADLDPVIGSEQNGHRPIIVIQNDIGNLYSPTTIAAMVTSSQKKKLPTHVHVKDESSGLSDDSIVMLEQIRTIDKQRLPTQAKSSMSFGEWMDLWYRHYCKQTIRETTRTSYENRIYQHIIPEIGSIALDKLTQNDLQDFYTRLKVSGRLQYNRNGRCIRSKLIPKRKPRSNNQSNALCEREWISQKDWNHCMV